MIRLVVMASWFGPIPVYSDRMKKETTYYNYIGALRTAVNRDRQVIHMVS